MIPQCKGKDLAKVPKSKLLQDGWYPSIKYDGNYVQIHKKDNEVQFWTSGGKQFYIEHIADELLNLNPDVDFIIECEYIADSEGKLGDRTKAAKLTTYRTLFSKGLESNTIPGKDIFKAFDCIAYGTRTLVNSDKFTKRLENLKSLELGTHIEVVEIPNKSFSLDKIKLSGFIKEGYEGLYLKHESHVYEPGKRVNTAIKLKSRATADLLCIDVEAGEGKYSEMIGALILQDSKGRIVKVGSGLSDEDRAMSPDWFLGKVVEIEYEQILDTYIQPTFITVRNDKTKNEID
jgi:ATP-dependent DNA ligase